METTPAAMPAIIVVLVALTVECESGMKFDGGQAMGLWAVLGRCIGASERSFTVASFVPVASRVLIASRGIGKRSAVCLVGA